MYKEFDGNKNNFLTEIFPDLKGGYFAYTTKLNRVLFKKEAQINLSEKMWEKSQVWFCPLVFETNKSRKRVNGLGSWVLWIDIDQKEYLPPIPPSILVETKNGFHAYYILEEFITDIKELEALNKALSKVSKGDSSWDAVHYLRVPYTWHRKDPNDPYLITVKSKTPLTYTPKTIKALLKLPQECLDYLSTGKSRDRSKSDYILLSEMLKQGLSEEKAIEVWTHSKGNAKLKERGKPYERSIVNRSRRNAETKEVQRRGPRNRTSRSNDGAKSYIENTEGTFVVTNNAMVHLCNFTAIMHSVITPKEAGEELLYTIKAEHSGKTYELTMMKSSFNSRRNLNNALSTTPLIWYEGDNLLAHYFEHLNKGNPKKVDGVKSIGLHYRENEPFYLFENGLLGADLQWRVPTEAHTNTYGDETVLKGYDINYDYKLHPDQNRAQELSRLLVNINKPEITWSLLGWFMSALYKPWLYTVNFKFPILSFLGPAGSGKTTTINLLMRVFGNDRPQSIVADTTIFSVLANLTATTTFPMNLSEVSATTRVKRLRSLFLTLYDGARATRGRRDQTLNDYNLTTPLILDGNYLPLTDRAFIERTVLLWAPTQELRTKEEEGALKKIRLILADGKVGLFEECVRHVLTTLTTNNNERQLKEIYRLLLRSNPTISERILKNYAVIIFGAHQFAKSQNLKLPDPLIFNNLIEQTKGIGRTDALSYFIEFVVETSIKRSDIDIILGDNVLGFRLNAMYNHFVQKTRVLPANLSRDGLKLALRGASYCLGTKRSLGLTYYLIDLEKAKDELNIPVQDLIEQAGKAKGRRMV